MLPGRHVMQSREHGRHSPGDRLQFVLQLHKQLRRLHAPCCARSAIGSRALMAGVVEQATLTGFALEPTSKYSDTRRVFSGPMVR